MLIVDGETGVQGLDGQYVFVYLYAMHYIYDRPLELAAQAFRMNQH